MIEEEFDFSDGEDFEDEEEEKKAPVNQNVAIEYWKEKDIHLLNIKTDFEIKAKKKGTSFGLAKAKILYENLNMLEKFINEYGG